MSIAHTISLRNICTYVGRYDFPTAETEKYVDKIVEGEERYDFYMELFLYKKAADTAIKMKSVARLQEVS